MFYCQKTGKLVGPKVGGIKVVVERRERTYETYNRKTKEKVFSEGWEVVKEIMVGPEGYQLLKSEGKV